jgi:hypothetical protein
VVSSPPATKEIGAMGQILPVYGSLKIHCWNSCIANREHQPQEREDPGSNPARV